MFSRRIPLSDLIDLCRVLRHQLGAGISLQRVLQKQGEASRASVRGVAARLAADLKQGVSLSDALEKERDAFPPLFLAMARLGETTGHLAEIFGELERYYQLELQLRRQFRNSTILPIVQFFFAVLIIAGVIFILGFLASLNNTRPMMTVFGLGGAAGSVAFLGFVFGTIALGWGVYALVLRVGRQKAWMHRLLLRAPSLGPCLYALAMSRLTLALQMTLDSGLSITRALRLSLEATGNAHFVAHADGIVRTLKKGRTLHEALAESKLFSPDFLDMVVSAEASGSVPEMMKHLALQYQEETGRRMTMLTRVAGGAVWCCVAGFIIWAIFSLYGIYFGALAQFAK